jgi:hypothetical protein
MEEPCFDEDAVLADYLDEYPEPEEDDYYALLGEEEDEQKAVREVQTTDTDGTTRETAMDTTDGDSESAKVTPEEEPLASVEEYLAARKQENQLFSFQRYVKTRKSSLPFFFWLWISCLFFTCLQIQERLGMADSTDFQQCQHTDTTGGQTQVCHVNSTTKGKGHGCVGCTVFGSVAVEGNG